MIRLAVPGMIMIEAEYLAFEILTLASSRFGPEALAAQSILATLASVTYQLPFSLSIASSTRIANLIGANLVSAAITSSQAVCFFPSLLLHHSTAPGTVLLTFFQAVALSVLLGLLNSTILWTLRYVLVGLFTDDEEVARLATGVMGILAIMQLSDAVSTGAHGLLRGIGQQHIGGYANLVGHYVFSLPFGLGTAFGLGWGLQGLWIGVASGVAGYVVSLSYVGSVFFSSFFHC